MRKPTFAKGNKYGRRPPRHYDPLIRALHAAINDDPRTQTEIAAASGWDVETIRRMLRQQAGPRFSVVKDVGAAVGLELTWVKK